MTKRYLPGTLNPLYENRSPYDLDTAEFNNPYYVRQLIKSFMGRNLEQNLFAGQGGETFNAIILGPDKFTFNNKDTGYATPVSALTKNEEHTWYHFRIPELHACLTDPCSPRVLKDKTKAFNAIKDHPSAPFVGGGAEKKVPALDPGTVVEIKFERGPTVGMAIQPTITRVLSRAFGLVNVPAECEKILDAFAKANGYSTNAIHSRSGPAKNQTPDVIEGAPIVNKLDETVGRSNRPLKPANVKHIVVHYTAGTTLKGAEATLAKDGTAYHYIIGRNGAINQYESLDQIAYASGGGREGMLDSANSVSISVAFVNLGYWREGLGLTKQEALNKGWLNCTGAGPARKTAIPWQPYTPAQINAFEKLATNIRKDPSSSTPRFPNMGKVGRVGSDTVPTVVGHEQVDGGKSDPGPAFWALYGSGAGTGGANPPTYHTKCDVPMGPDDGTGALMTDYSLEGSICEGKEPAPGPPMDDCSEHDGYSYYTIDSIKGWLAGDTDEPSTQNKCPAGCYKD